MNLKYPKDYWQTPPAILDTLYDFFDGVFFDPCPINPDFDGLKADWPPYAYINPPFSQYLQWVQHGLRQPMEQIWMLNHDHSTQHFRLLATGSALCMPQKRIYFIHPDTGKPIKDQRYCQTLIYRGHDNVRFGRVFSRLGLTVEKIYY